MKLVRILAAFVLSLAAGSAAAELVVVVSARSPVATLRADQVADIFLGQVGRFPDGSEAVPLDQAFGAPLRTEFYAKVAGKSPHLMKAHWTKMIFTGRGQPPKELPNSAAVRRLVADNPALIGYLEKAALDSSVRPVLLVP